MASIFTAIVRAPLTGIVLILEMTGNQEQLFALILACLIAYLVAEHARSTPIYDALLQIDLQKDRSETTPTSAEPYLLLITVASHSIMDGARIRNLNLPADTVFISIRRGNEEFIATANSELMIGDHILVATHRELENEIRELAKTVA